MRSTFGEPPNMMPQLKRNNFKKTFFAVHNLLSQKRGSILVYIIVVMLIFAVLGAAMVSLFSTSVSSSATANESRRAFYLAESGLRYGLSELRKVNGFSTLNIATLNDTLYKMPPSGDFDITVFGAWFISLTDQEGGNKVSLKVEKGKIPDGYIKNLRSATAHLYIVAVGSDLSFSNSVAKVTDVNQIDETSIEFFKSDDFKVSSKKPWSVAGTVCMAVPPDKEWTFTPSGDSTAYLDLKQTAVNIFPKTDGCFLLRGIPYFYNSATDLGGSFRLNNITLSRGIDASPVTVKETDYVTLANNNYFVTSKGTSGNVTYGGGLDQSASLCDRSSSDIIGPDIRLTLDNVRRSNESFMSGGVDSVTKTEYLQIGGVSGSHFGTMWFNKDLSLGGATDRCTYGACSFKTGFRIFFTFEYSGSGDGFIFTLINGSGHVDNDILKPLKNDTGSAGGDVQQSELLGYSGDSRLDPDGNSFLDNSTIGTPPPRGLLPPKIGLEFDAKVNYSPSFEKSVNYCPDFKSDPTSKLLAGDSRNDPGSSGQHMVQYVFWGNSAVDIPCRDNNPSYDDNRHDATGAGTGDWIQSTSHTINTSPALSPDGNTIYVGSGTKLFAFDTATGAKKWEFSTGGTVYSPAVAYSGSDKGTIYIGSGGDHLYAINPDGTEKWPLPYLLPSGAINTKPAVGHDGTIFFSANQLISGYIKHSYFYALNPDKSQRWNALPNPQGPIGAYALSPVLSNDETYVYLATSSGTIFRISYNTGGFSNYISIAPINFSPSGGLSDHAFSPYVRADGTLFVGALNSIYAIAPGPSASFFTTGSNPVSSSPTAGSDGMVYAGNYDTYLYAKDTQGLGRDWRFKTGGDINSQPTIDANNHIYFGSNDDYIYALYNDGRLKWKKATGGDVRGKPVVKTDGTTFVGSFDYNFYAINQFANPKNLKDNFLTAWSGSPVKIGGTIESTRVAVQVDDTSSWFTGSPSIIPLQDKRRWAVRMEVINKTAPELDGTFEYKMQTWIRQCNDINCSNISGTFFDNTRVNYPTNLKQPQLEQTIRLNSDDNSDFETFLFGFTSALKSGDTQTVKINEFSLSFRRDNDQTPNPLLPDPNLP